MSFILQLYLEKLKANSEDTFLFRRLYHNPKSVLGTNEFIDELIDYPNLIMNSDLMNFLTLAIEDKDFISKLDLALHKKLCDILNESVKIKINYLLTEEISPKVKKIFKSESFEERIKNFSIEKAATLSHDIKFQIKTMYDIIEMRKLNKVETLDTIEHDNYDKDPFLEKSLITYAEINNKIFYSLVCENKFLEIIEKLFSQNKIKNYVLDNVIEILEFSINVKTYSIKNAKAYRDKLDEETLKTFSLEKANSLLYKLRSLKHNKCHLKLIPNKTK